MDPRTNPYAPGAGTPPPELAGRDGLIEAAAVALDRIRDGLSARSLVIYGLRGVGKTVLLNQMRLNAEANGLVTVPVEAPEGRSLPAILLPSLRSSLIRVSRSEATKAGFKKVFGILASFAKAFRVKYADIDFSIDIEPEEGIADSGEQSEELFREISNLVTARGNVYSIFSIGQTITQTPDGRLIVTAEQRTRTIIERFLNPANNKIEFGSVYFRNLNQ